MNTNNLKKVAPRARTAFIAAIKARAAEFGITAKGHVEYQLSGEVMQVAGFTHPASIAPALKRLQQRLEHEGFENLMEQMAYTWFNRFCAIRFMATRAISNMECACSPIRASHRGSRCWTVRPK